MDTEAPHSYKAQRKLERSAVEARKGLLDSGATLPPVCGYTYTPRKPQNHSGKFDPAPVVCMRVAGTNTDHHGRGYCDYHDWQAEHDMSKQQVQVQAARNEAHRQVQFLGLPVPTDPHTALMDEVQRSAGIVEWLRHKLISMAEEYERARHSGLIPDGDWKPSENDLLVQFTAKNGQQPSAWWILYQEERKHLIAASVAAIKAGVAERKVRIAEQQGQLIVAMFQAFIHDPELGLSPEQIMAAPGLIRRHMAALPREEPRAITAHATG